jgi:hypothetical protein
MDIQTNNGIEFINAGFLYVHVFTVEMKLQIFLLVHETIVAMISSVKKQLGGVTLAFG